MVHLCQNPACEIGCNLISFLRKHFKKNYVLTQLTCCKLGHVKSRQVTGSIMVQFQIQMVLSWSFKRESLNKAASELNNTPVGYFFFPLDYLEGDSEQSLVIEAFHKAINSGTEDLNHDDSLNFGSQSFMRTIT